MGPKGVPYIVTHDGRTIRFPNPKIKINDTIKLNLKTNEIMDVYKFEIGAYCMITKGNNIGRCGQISKVEKHEGSYEIIHVKDDEGQEFSTRLENVFISGKTKHEVQLLKRYKRFTIIQERDLKEKGKITREEEGEE